ncbi:MAG: aminopeptidase [Bacteroidetes bacterium]|nr:aminopeptidase [Bacteroidota bacterium]
MIRKISFASLWLFAAFPLFAQTSLQLTLQSFPEVQKIEALESSHFAEKYLLYVQQPVDYQNPDGGSFVQRVFVMHVGADRPTVMVTEGYGAAYAASPRYIDEVARLLNANLVVVEHRYFLESTPQPVNWDYLTAENSANDLHRINQMLRTIYPQKWISTGISKGGQTVMIYRTFFPDDIDVSVPYVGPLCRGVEDGRHEPFLRDQVGSTEDRAQILAFQHEILKRRARLMPLLEALCNEKEYRFRIPLQEVFDYTVLEYPFAFWQYGTPTGMIPDLQSDDETLFKHFTGISDPGYFVSESDTSPFFVQAAKELGYYGYDIEPFKDQLTITDSRGYLARIFLPEDMQITFDPTLYHKISSFISDSDAKFIFIYGEYDPWFAPAAPDPHRPDVLYIVAPKGSHRARIGNLPEEMRERILQTLHDWID